MTKDFVAMVQCNLSTRSVSRTFEPLWGNLPRKLKEALTKHPMSVRAPWVSTLHLIVWGGLPILRLHRVRQDASDSNLRRVTVADYKCVWGCLHMVQYRIRHIGVSSALITVFMFVLATERFEGCQLASEN